MLGSVEGVMSTLNRMSGFVTGRVSFHNRLLATIMAIARTPATAHGNNGIAFDNYGRVSDGSATGTIDQSRAENDDSRDELQH